MKMLNDMELNMVAGGNLYLSSDSYDGFDIADDDIYVPDKSLVDGFGSQEFVFI